MISIRNKLRQELLPKRMLQHRTLEAMIRWEETERTLPDTSHPILVLSNARIARILMEQPTVTILKWWLIRK